MKRGIVLTCMVAALVGAFALGQARAQEEGNDEMAAWKALATPGPEHAALMKTIGIWDVEVRQLLPEPRMSNGKAVRAAALGGRFVKEEFEGTMMGEAFHGLGYMGFDNATRKYQFAWMDSWGTGIMLQTGTEIEPGKAWEYKGSFFGPNGVEMKSRSVVRRVSDDETVMEMFNDMGTGEAKCMEMTYRRAR